MSKARPWRMLREGVEALLAFTPLGRQLCAQLSGALKPTTSSSTTTLLLVISRHLRRLLAEDCAFFRLPSHSQTACLRLSAKARSSPILFPSTGTFYAPQRKSPIMVTLTEVEDEHFQGTQPGAMDDDDDDVGPMPMPDASAGTHGARKKRKGTSYALERHQRTEWLQYSRTSAFTSSTSRAQTATPSRSCTATQSTSSPSRRALTL